MDDDYEDDECRPPTGWQGVGPGRMHWSDFAALAFIGVQLIGDGLSQLGEVGASIFKAHSNAVTRDREFKASVLADIERLPHE